MFYDKITDTISYYSQIITSMIQLIVMIEKNASKLSIPSMTYIVEQQLLYPISSYSDTTTACSYMSWIENIIYEKISV